MSFSDTDAGWVLLSISLAAWVFYAGSRAFDEYRHMKRRQQGVLGLICRQMENRRM